MKRVTLLVIALSVLLAACSGGDSAATTTAPQRDLMGATATTAASTEDESGGSSVGVPAVDNRQVIYDGNLQLEAVDTRDAFNSIVFLVESSGGFLSASQIGESLDEEQPAINFTVRVPTDKLTATLSGIRDVADRVVTESLQSQDVTDQFVDIEAQLRNLYALEEELLLLLAELRDNPEADPGKLLAVFDQIRITRGEIEQLEGRRQLLTNLVSLATISIGITPLPAAIPIIPTDPVWEPATVAKEALRNLIEALQVVGTMAIRFVLYTLPVLVLVLGPFALIGWWLWRRPRRAKQVPIGPTLPES